MFGVKTLRLDWLGNSAGEPAGVGMEWVDLLVLPSVV